MIKIFLYSFLILCSLIGCNDKAQVKEIQPGNKYLHAAPIQEDSANIEIPVDTVLSDSILVEETPDEKEIKKSEDNHTQIANIKDSTKYYIYLTLDDGPQPGTLNCYKILKENNIPATFFMIGSHNTGKGNNQLVDSINKDTLFLISNHSNTHAFHNKYKSFYSQPDKAIQDFIDAENKLTITNKIIRLPGRNTWALNKKVKGESSAFSVAKKLDSMGYYVYGWDTEWNFTNGNVPVESAQQMAKKVEYQLRDKRTFKPNTIVILVHDRMFEKQKNADSFKEFITLLKNNDQYVFETLDNYPLITAKENKTEEPKPKK